MISTEFNRLSLIPEIPSAQAPGADALSVRQTLESAFPEIQGITQTPDLKL